MKSIFKLLLIVILSILSISPKPSYTLDMSDRIEYLADVKSDNGDIIRNYLKLHKKCEPSKILFSIFLDSQWNLDITDWEKIKAGVSAEKEFFKYLYISQSVQFISGYILDRVSFDTNYSSVDTTSRMAIIVPFRKRFSLSIAEELSINLEQGREEYAESIAELSYSPKDSHSFGIGWRHTDRVHNFDTDYVTASFALHF